MNEAVPFLDLRKKGEYDKSAFISAAPQCLPTTPDTPTAGRERAAPLEDKRGFGLVVYLLLV